MAGLRRCSSRMLTRRRLCCERGGASSGQRWNRASPYSRCITLEIRRFCGSFRGELSSQTCNPLAATSIEPALAFVHAQSVLRWHGRVEHLIGRSPVASMWCFSYDCDDFTSLLVVVLKRRLAFQVLAACQPEAAHKLGLLCRPVWVADPPNDTSLDCCWCTSRHGLRNGPDRREFQSRGGSEAC